MVKNIVLLLSICCAIAIGAMYLTPQKAHAQCYGSNCTCDSTPMAVTAIGQNGVPASLTLSGRNGCSRFIVTSFDASVYNNATGSAFGWFYINSGSTCGAGTRYLQKYIISKDTLSTGDYGHDFGIGTPNTSSSSPQPAGGGFDGQNKKVCFASIGTNDYQTINVQGYPTL